MKFSTDIWVAALIRRVELGGGHAVVVRKGDARAGSVLVKVIRRPEGSVRLFAEATRADGTRLFDPATTTGLLVFYVLAMQCLPTLAVTRRETGSWKWAMLQLGWMSVVAYLLAWFARMLVIALGGGA